MIINAAKIKMASCRCTSMSFTCAMINIEIQIQISKTKQKGGIPADWGSPPLKLKTTMMMFLCWMQKMASCTSRRRGGTIGTSSFAILPIFYFSQTCVVLDCFSFSFLLQKWSEMIHKWAHFLSWELVLKFFFVQSANVLVQCVHV